METEIWASIPGFEDYEISTHGRVKNKVGRIMKTFKRKGYKYLKFPATTDRIRTSHGIHRLVGLLFVPNPENKPVIDHKDRDPLNNYYKNLRWLTVAENNLNLGAPIKSITRKRLTEVIESLPEDFKVKDLLGVLFPPEIENVSINT